MEDTTLIFLIISNSFLLITNVIQLAFKAKHFRSSCCQREIFDLKNSISKDLRELDNKNDLEKK